MLHFDRRSCQEGLAAHPWPLQAGAIQPTASKAFLGHGIPGELGMSKYHGTVQETTCSCGQQQPQCRQHPHGKFSQHTPGFSAG